MGWPFVRVKVAERSMLPALHPGDWLLVRRTRRIRPGQIVLARHPGRPEMLIVKRAARRSRTAGGSNRTTRGPVRWTAAASAPSRHPDRGPRADPLLAPPLRLGPRQAAAPRPFFWAERAVVLHPGQAPARTRTAPLRDGAVRAWLACRSQWCSPVSGRSSTPLCWATRCCISSCGSLVAIAQK